MATESSAFETFVAETMKPQAERARRILDGRQPSRWVRPSAARDANDFARDVWLDGMRAQIEAPSLVDQMVAAGFIVEPTFTTRWPNPYGAHRYPRLGLMRTPRRLENDRDWWDDDY